MFSAGYFLSDLLVMMTNSKDTMDMLSVFHHLIIGPSFIMGAYGKVTVVFQFMFLFEELSTVFLNLRWFTRSDLEEPNNKSQKQQQQQQQQQQQGKEEIKKNNLQFWNDLSNLAFVLTFLLSRILFGTILTYPLAIWHYLVLDPSLLTDSIRYQYYWQFTMCTLSRFLNIYWTFLIFNKIFGSKKPKNKSKKSQNKR